MDNIYFDHNATTAVAPEVLDEVLPWLTGRPGFGNPARKHWSGLPAATAVENAREQVAHLIAAETAEMIFTSGGSESVNHAIKGIFFAYFNVPGKKHIITSEIEHPCAKATCDFLRDCFGAEITVVPVDSDGVVDVGVLRRAIRLDTILVNIMHVSHEVGTIQPIQEISKITRENNVLFHVDATCSVGKNVVDVNELGCDLLSFSGHKFYSPKGVGALYISESVRQGLTGRHSEVYFQPLIHGSAPKQAYRSGTANVPSIVGMGKASELASQWNTQANRDSLHGLIQHFWTCLQNEFGDDVVLNSPTDQRQRICNTLNVSFIGHNGENVLELLPNVAASSGPKSLEVVKALGRSLDVAKGAIRFSLGRKNTLDEVEAVVSYLKSKIYK